MDEQGENYLTSEAISGIIPTSNELRILENLRKAAARWPQGHFGPVTFFTHKGGVHHGILKETEGIETRL